MVFSSHWMSLQPSYAWVSSVIPKLIARDTHEIAVENRAIPEIANSMPMGSSFFTDCQFNSALAFGGSLGTVQMVNKVKMAYITANAQKATLQLPT